MALFKKKIDFIKIFKQPLKAVSGLIANSPLRSVVQSIPFVGGAIVGAADLTSKHISKGESLAQKFSTPLPKGALPILAPSPSAPVVPPVVVKSVPSTTTTIGRGFDSSAPQYVESESKKEHRKQIKRLRGEN